MFARVEKEDHTGRWELEAAQLAQRFANKTGKKHGVNFSMGNHAAGMCPAFVVSAVVGSDKHYNRGVYFPQAP